MGREPATGGFADSMRTTARGSATVGRDLYLGLENDRTDEGEVWRTRDGLTWVKAAPDSFGQGTVIDHVDSFAVFGNALYAGMDIGQIWRTTDGTVWTRATPSPGLDQNITDLITVFGGSSTRTRPRLRRPAYFARAMERTGAAS